MACTNLYIHVADLYIYYCFCEGIIIDIHKIHIGHFVQSNFTLEGYFYMYMFLAKKKQQTKTLLDNTRSRNIEIFLPSFPFPLDGLQTTLSDQLNSVTASLGLTIDHIVALKRYICTYIHTAVSFIQLYNKYVLLNFSM